MLLASDGNVGAFDPIGSKMARFSYNLSPISLTECHTDLEVPCVGITQNLIQEKQNETNLT